MKAVFEHMAERIRRTGLTARRAWRECSRPDWSRLVRFSFGTVWRQGPTPPASHAPRHFHDAAPVVLCGAVLCVLLTLGLEIAPWAAPAPEPTDYRANVGFGEERYPVPDEERFLIPGEQRFHAPGQDMFAVAPGSAANATNFFAQAADEFGLPRRLLSAIAFQESTFHPWAINTNGKTYYPDSKREALRLLERMNPRSYDLGVMQINSFWIRKYDLDPVKLLDPEINIRWGAWILWDCAKRFGSDWRGVAAYHTGHPDTDPERGKRYASKVFRHMKRITAEAAKAGKDDS